MANFFGGGNPFDVINDIINIPNFGKAAVNGIFFNVPLNVDLTRTVDVPGFQTPFPMILVADSYSVGDRCYCHNIVGFEGSDVTLSTPLGFMTAEEVCDYLGPGPGSIGRPLYNDAQCGNGPFIGTDDEETCPGRVDHGIAGCGVIGPLWNFDGLA